MPNVKTDTAMDDKTALIAGSQFTKNTIKQIFWQTSINEQRPKLRIRINGLVLEGLVDTGADVTIITPKSWHPNWPLQEVDVQLLGIGTLSQIKQSSRWVECIGPEGQRGRLKPYVANVAVNLWGRDLLQQWNTQIKIPTLSEKEYRPMHVSRNNIITCYKNQSPTIQAVHKQSTTVVELSEVPTALPLKWLTNKPVWVGQWPLTKEKLQALEQLVQEQLNAQHIEESTSPWNSPVFIFKSLVIGEC